MSQEQVWQLDPEPSSAAEARRLVRTLGLRHHACRRSELLVTELVGNAVHHAGLADGDRIEVAVEERPDAGRLHVEVSDPGPGFDPESPADHQDGELHLGLQLLERLSDAWGVRRAEGRTRVWFELAL
ncbi:ATP-binding protein [Conexibacter sp. SYSU D00693]|uniref:ATP-binding protein n=1 Tax=Conexibacter sp. SYSU D00693 TaxID=2812560 RepID=UPI00196AD792|nr:ATP-binding protein [Conexibacter sp. SYSU D00693]